MRQKPRTVVAVLPDGREYFADISGVYTERSVAEEAVRKLGFTTPRSDPQPVKVQIYELYIQDGFQRRRVVVMCDVVPPLLPMTNDEYRQEMDAAIAPLPEEFRPYVQAAAWERASGNEEAVSYARGMVADLEAVVAAYTKRITENNAWTKPNSPSPKS